MPSYWMPETDSPLHIEQQDRARSDAEARAGKGPQMLCAAFVLSALCVALWGGVFVLACRAYVADDDAAAQRVQDHIDRYGIEVR
jgi:hypothetical protein